MDAYEIELQKQMCAADWFVCQVKCSRTWLNYTNELETITNCHVCPISEGATWSKRLLSKPADAKGGQNVK